MRSVPWPYSLPLVQMQCQAQRSTLSVRQQLCVSPLRLVCSSVPSSPLCPLSVLFQRCGFDPIDETDDPDKRRRVWEAKQAQQQEEAAAAASAPSDSLRSSASSGEHKEAIKREKVDPALEALANTISPW